MTKRFDAVVEKFAVTSPGFKVKFKDESWLMKLIGFLMFFNSKFMTSFVTTIGKTIYFPSRSRFADRTENSNIAVVCHEYMHTRDYDRLGILFFLAYMFPLILLPLVVPLYWVSWPIALVLTVLCLAPLPAPGRMYFELRGYTMSLFSYNELAKELGNFKQNRIDVMTKMVESINQNFTSFEYYLMWPFGVEKQLLEAVDLIASDELPNTDGIYKEVAEVLAATKSV